MFNQLMIYKISPSVDQNHWQKNLGTSTLNQPVKIKYPNLKLTNERMRLENCWVLQNILKFNVP